jgi:two-component system LytT family response regulator
MLIRTLIIDDEPLAREGIRLRLTEEPDIQIVGEAGDGPSAVKAINRLTPDLVFLDVQMPGFDGLEVLNRISPELLPFVVFVTAYDQYAVKAFEADAIDYLCKPISEKRLHQTLQRVRLELAKEVVLGGQDHGRLTRASQSENRGAADQSTKLLQERAGSFARIAVKDQNRFLILKPNKIQWIDSAGNYVQLHSNGRIFLLRTTMDELESWLDPQVFARIHRTAIVNIDCIQEILLSEHSDYTIVLIDGTKLRLSRKYHDHLFSHIYPHHEK